MKVLHLYKQSKPVQGGIETFISILQEMFPSITELTYTSFKRSRRGRLLKLGTFKGQPIGFPIFRLTREIGRYDIVHLHYPTVTLDLVVLFVMKVFYPSKRLIVSYHAGVINSRFGKYLVAWKYFENALLSRANLIHVSNQRVLGKGSFSAKVNVVPFPVKQRLIINNHLLESRYSQKRILFVGALRAYKGLNVLLSALSLSDNWTECVIVGKGEQKLYLTNLIIALGLEERVHILSNVGDEELLAYYRNSSLFILPSINNSETFGIVQVEALAAGLPIINTKLDTGVPLVSLDGVSGKTVTPGDSNELASAISKLLSDKEFYFKCSHGAVSLSERYSYDTVKQTFKRLYGL